MKEIIEALQKSARQAEERARADQQEKVQKALLEINTKVFEKAQAYLNIIILAGYAGAFTIWTYTKGYLSQTANIWVASMLGLSLVIFVLWEVFGMIVRTRQFLRTRKLIIGHSDPETFFRHLKQAQEGEATMMLWIMPIWGVVLSLCVALALGAVGLLFYNYFALIVGWPLWPRD